MIGKRCSLCGGKIVHGKCVDCGLDATKNDSQYKPNESNCDYEPETYKPETYETENKKQKKVISMWKDLEHSARNREIVKDSKKKSKYGVMIAIIIVIISLLGEGIGAFFRFAENTVNQITEGTSLPFIDSTHQSYEEAGEYQYVTRELSETGEQYEMTLTAGFYQIGEQIPEGIYSFKVESGNGQYTLRDSENRIFLYESMGDDSDYNDELTECEDVHMYAGAWLEVTNNLQLKITTENAQSSTMTSLMDNPNTEPVVLDGINGKDSAVTGEDLKAGTYDITVMEGYGNLDFYIPDHTYVDEDTQEEYATESIYLDADNEYGAYTYHNVSIPEGTRVVYTDLHLQLTPTSQIGTTDYMKMWDVIW